MPCAVLWVGSQSGGRTHGSGLLQDSLLLRYTGRLKEEAAVTLFGFIDERIKQNINGKI